MLCVKNVVCWRKRVCNAVILHSHWSYIVQMQVIETPFTLLQETVPSAWFWSCYFELKKLHNAALKIDVDTSEGFSGFGFPIEATCWIWLQIRPCVINPNILSQRLQEAWNHWKDNIKSGWYTALNLHCWKFPSHFCYLDSSPIRQRPAQWKWNWPADQQWKCHTCVPECDSRTYRTVHLHNKTPEHDFVCECQCHCDL